MNIENIAALVTQLELLGFDITGLPLLKRVCFRPVNFTIRQKIIKNGDQFFFHLFFERDEPKNIYSLSYYDVSMQKEAVLPDAPLHGVNLVELSSKMNEVNWKEAFDVDANKNWDPADNNSWENERRVYIVTEAMQQLEKDEEGKVFASALKLKYWFGLPFNDMAGDISPVKGKPEISQRFYLPAGQPGISVGEACRFLQNRWLEKHMQNKKKTGEMHGSGNDGDDPKSVPASGLIVKKKHLGSRGKKSKAGQS